MSVCVKNLSYLKLKSILTNFKLKPKLSRNLCSQILNHNSSNGQIDFKNNGTHTLVKPVVTDLNLVEYPEVDAGEYLTDEIVKKMPIPKALDICEEDLSGLAPNLLPTFNFAAYANYSETIQELVKLGVELWKLEDSPDKMECILQRNFDDMKPYIQFLHDSGVAVDEIGKFITKNPQIFKQDMDDLKTRIRYLRAHKFSRDDIARIVTSHPCWLNFTTKFLDQRLGFFQKEFKLNGNEVRFLTVRKPILITHKQSELRENIFCVREQMGFYPEEMKLIILNKPTVYTTERYLTLRNFEYVHNEMMISHELIARMPYILNSTLDRIKSRHLFLKSLKRDQYDPTKPLYVSLDDIASPTDHVFCAKSARTSIELYDMFLRSL
ncbi:transcription termination factor 3, mitochondrial [Microplitis demolitor]|uniref:transcription termination factor 3, mitochondrial n=1 Tax=Microplitis demolitor TaxID=69319 RepID=UPI00043FFF2C|nr:transcription termination factor 3, mitochondrial [Microplitis demolitor]